MKQYLTSLPVLVAPDPGETLFLYLVAMAEVISMVLVTERSEHLPQGAPVDPLVGEEGPASASLTTGLASEGPAGSRPGKQVVTRGLARPQPKEKDLVRLAESRPSGSWSTTPVRSFMRQRLGTLRRISSFMLFLLRPGNFVIISRPTRLWW
jgi:hypothetical protein